MSYDYLGSWGGGVEKAGEEWLEIRWKMKMGAEGWKGKWQTAEEAGRSIIEARAKEEKTRKVCRKESFAEREQEGKGKK
jgi:hypothetical protein